MKGIKILASGCYAPEKVVTNNDFSAVVDTSDEWITTRTGMKRRHLASGEYTWQMAVKAAQNAIKKSGISAKDIGMVICSSVTPDYSTPSISCMVQRELEIKDCIAFDLNAACTGLVYALDIASKYLMSNTVKYALVIGAENLTKIVDYNDRSTCVLFGDGASAIIATQGEGMVASFLGADGAGAKFMIARRSKPHNAFADDSVEFIDDGLPESENEYLVMDGREVYKFAIKAMPHAINEACNNAGITPEELSIIIPHQANIRIIETAATRLGISMDKVYVNIQEYGNTSSASIGIALDEAFEKGMIKKGDKVCLVGFGAGLTYGAIIFDV